MAGNLGAFERDRLGFLCRARADFGDLVSFDDRTTIVNSPVAAARLLDDPHQEFAVVHNFLGDRVVGDHHALRRRVHRHLSGSMREPTLAAVRAVTDDGVAQRFPVAGGQMRIEDVTGRLEGIMSHVVATVFFAEHAPRVVGPVADLFDALESTFLNPFTLPSAVPTPRRRRVRTAHRAARAAVQSAMVLGGVGGPTVTGLAHNLVSSDDSTAVAERCADLVVGAMLASRRVPAAGAAWVMKALVSDAGLQDELLSSSSVTGDQRVPSCPARRSLLNAVVSETLRLYPPTWLIRRTSLTPVELGDFAFPAGHHFIVSPYVLHRDPRTFDQPNDFNPQRWWHDRRGLGAQSFSFGRGPRRCPGAGLAQTAVEAATQALITRFVLSESLPASSTTWRADASGTLVPRDAVLALSPRAGRHQRAGRGAV